MITLKKSTFLKIFQSTHSVALYHTLLGKLHFAELPILEFLELLDQGISAEELQSRFPDVDIPIQMQRLHKLHFLATDEEDARILNHTQRMDVQYQDGQLISTLRLNISTACNLACLYCYGNPQVESVPTQTMSSSMAERAIGLYVELLHQYGKKKMNIRFFGGEPLMNWAVMHHSMKYARTRATQYDMQLTMLINTNGTLLTQEIVDTLNEFDKFIRIIISLDGTASSHNQMRRTRTGQDSFDSVFSGIKRAQAKGLNFTPNIVVGQHNINQLRGIIDFLISEGIYQTGLNPVIITGQSEQKALVEKMLEAVEYAKQKGVSIGTLWMRPIHALNENTTATYCSGSGSELSVMPDGSIYPCQTQPFHLGSLDDLETKALFKTETYRQVALRTAGNIPACRGCEIEGLCAGGCAGDAYAVHKNIYAPTQHCEFMRAVTKAHIYQLMKDFDEYRETVGS